MNLLFSMNNKGFVSFRLTEIDVYTPFFFFKGKCCGVNNFSDFNAASHFQANKTKDQVIPVACCKLDGPAINFKPTDPSCITNPTKENSNFQQVM